MPYVKPIDKIQAKPEIIKYAKIYLEKDSWLDMNGFIWSDMNYPEAPTSFILDVAKRMVRTGLYEMDIQEVTNRYLIYPLPKKTLRDSSPFIFQVVIICITVLFTTTATYITQSSQRQSQRLQDYQQDERLNLLSDSLKNGQKQIKALTDSLKYHKYIH